MMRFFYRRTVLFKIAVYMIVVVFSVAFFITKSFAADITERYLHSWYINSQNSKEKAESLQPDRKEVAFSYMCGTSGEFHLLTQYKADWQAWTNNGNPPAVGPWYVSGTTDIDGAITFHAPADGLAKIGSSIPVSVEENAMGTCDGVQFMIIQKGSKGYFPLWPKKGSFEWYKMKGSSSVEVKDIATYMKKGESILYVVHSIGSAEGDTVAVDPDINFDTTSKGEYPSGWKKWPKTERQIAKTTAVQKGGTQINTPTAQKYDGKTARHSSLFNTVKPSNGPFKYMSGYDGKYSELTMYNKEWGGWTQNGSAPTVGSNYLSATLNNDAVIVYTADKAGMASIKSAEKLFLQFGNKSDGCCCAIVLKNSNGEHPLWPKDGAWDYFELKGEKKTELPEIKTYLRKGDEIYFICRSTGTDLYDTFNLDPVIQLDTSVPDNGNILAATQRKALDEEALASNLPEPSGKLDLPASTTAVDQTQDSTSANDIQQPEEENKGGVEVNKEADGKGTVIGIVLACAVTVAIIGTVLFLVIRKRKPGKM